MKFYQKPHLGQVVQYHKLQNYFGNLVREELGGRILFPGNYSWKREQVRTASLRIITLPEDAVYDTYGELVGIGKTPKVCPEGYGYRCVSEINYVGGETLPYEDEGADEMRERITEALKGLGLPLSERNPISPANVKVSSFYKGELALVVTDIGASIMNLLESVEANPTL